MKNQLAVIILAAGKGTRLGGEDQKVVKRVSGRPMILYLMDTLETLHPRRIVLIVGHRKEQVYQALEGRDVEYAEQKERRGTGDAVLHAEGALSGYSGNVIILCGDTPLISSATLEKLVSAHLEGQNCATVLTAEVEEPTGYGRIKRDKAGNVAGIIEELNADDSEKQIREINSGIYIFKKDELFDSLRKVKPDGVKGEYYLTDVIKILVSSGKKVGAYTTLKPEECIGINTDADLKRAESILKGISQ